MVQILGTIFFSDTDMERFEKRGLFIDKDDGKKSF